MEDILILLEKRQVARRNGQPILEAEEVPLPLEEVDLDEYIATIDSKLGKEAFSQAVANEISDPHGSN